MQNNPNQESRESEKTQYIGDELELFSYAKNWKSYWASKIRPLLKEPILEVGAGIGSNLALLRVNQQAWTALEPDKNQTRQIRQKIGSEEKIDIICGVLNDLNPNTRYQTIIYIDVLEHIERDRNEVRRASEFLCQGGRLIILSPAHDSLFSPFDKAVGHFRRYNKQQLKNLTPVGSKIEQLYYLDSLGYAASYANAKMLRSTMPNKRQILFWDRVMVPISRMTDKILRYKFGKTIVVVWQKL